MRTKTAATSPLTPGAAEIAAMACLVVFYLLAEEMLGRDAPIVVNVAGPVAFTLINGLAAWRMLKLDTRSLFTPLFTYRVSAAVYFGLGQMVHLVVSPERVQFLETLYAYHPFEVAKLNLLIALCALLVVVATRAILPMFPALEWSFARKGGFRFSLLGSRLLRNYGLGMLIVGSLLKYFFVFPVSMGWAAWGDVPGFIATAAEMSLIGISLLTIWSLSAAPAYFPAVCLVVAVEVFTGLLLFSKTQVLLPLLMLVSGIMVQKVSVSRVATGLALVAFTVEFMQPLAGYSRNEFNARTGNDPSRATLLTRVEVLQSYFDPNRRRQAYEESGEGLLRFAYVNAGTLAIALYDRGNAGNSYRYVFVALVPRLLWPEKPLLQEGGEFSAIATGRGMDNSVSPGLFPEAYWNFGWLGAPLIAAMLSLFMVVMSRYSLWVLGEQRWLFFPIALVGMKAGLGIDGMFVGLISGTAAIILGLHVITAMVERLFDRRSPDGPQHTSVGRFLSPR